jgi:diguanylate cyclase (GGDEF)-like protein
MSGAQPNGFGPRSADQPVSLRMDLRELLAWRPDAMRFDATDERRFNRARGPARMRHFVVSGTLALLAYNLFLLTDRNMVPDVFDLAVRLRLLYFTPVALALLAGGIVFRRHLLRWPVWALEGGVAMTGVAAAATLAWLLLHSHSPYAGMYMAGMVPVLVYGNLVQRFRFRYALISSLMVVAICAVGTWLRQGVPRPLAVFDLPLVLLVLLIAIYTLIMNWRLEQEERRRFIWSTRARGTRVQLAASRVQLDEASRVDPLTGVPNRRAVDGFLHEQWDAVYARGGELSLLMIDVDHFKAFNDRYGHPAGDQCLRHVAQVLHSVLGQRLPGDQACVGRWGGEEFVVVLPGLSASQAMPLAQALCDAVLAMGLRHEASSTAPSVSISVGLASARPASQGGSASRLIDQADAALYRAKHEGRNRCVPAEA